MSPFFFSFARRKIQDGESGWCNTERQSYHIANSPVYETMKTILTITGSDSTSESGVQADIRTITALGVKAVSVITSVTIQNTIGIQDFYDLPAAVVSGQLDAIINDVEPEVVKIGMIRSADVLAVIVGALKKYKPTAVVYDPILFSSRGDRLMGMDAIEQVRSQLFPLCTVIVMRKRESTLLLKDYIKDNVCLLDDSVEHGYANSFASALSVYLSQGQDTTTAMASAQAFISRQTAKPDKLQGRSGELYNEFISRVSEQYGQNSDVAHYADILNVSGRYLAQVCRRIAGKSPKNIIDSYIVKGITVRLATTGDTIQAIACDFGFANQAHLSKFFKNQMGLSPTEYRRKVSQEAAGIATPATHRRK